VAKLNVQHAARTYFCPLLLITQAAMSVYFVLFLVPGLACVSAASAAAAAVSGFGSASASASVSAFAPVAVEPLFPPLVAGPQYSTASS
jgi:hypothetical protein